MTSDFQARTPLWTRKPQASATSTTVPSSNHSRPRRIANSGSVSSTRALFIDGPAGSDALIVTNLTLQSFTLDQQCMPGDQEGEGVGLRAISNPVCDLEVNASQCCERTQWMVLCVKTSQFAQQNYRVPLWYKGRLSHPPIEGRRDASRTIVHVNKHKQCSQTPEPGPQYPASSRKRSHRLTVDSSSLKYRGEYQSNANEALMPHLLCIYEELYCSGTTGIAHRGSDQERVRHQPC